MAQTTAFTVIIMLEKVNVFNFRALQAPLATIGFFSNPFLLVAWVVEFGLQLCVIYVPLLQEAFHTVPLGWTEWGWIAITAVPIFILMEGYKWLRFYGTRKEAE
jgi:Ca2+-transporting ATPase